ncbi:hypothetical protein VNO77_34239 [Canavalia gladiata]|uniref:Uncharacterized protein n=1 Tax=Canavalia gladiata TaxID=3824 RepID=A0AAN9KDZ3_CANGL
MVLGGEEKEVSDLGRNEEGGFERGILSLSEHSKNTKKLNEIGGKRKNLSGGHRRILQRSKEEDTLVQLEDGILKRKSETHRRHLSQSDSQIFSTLDSTSLDSLLLPKALCDSLIE